MNAPALPAPVAPADKDLELWRRWHASRAVPDLEALVAQLLPILRREVGRWTSVAPAFVLEAEAKRLAVKAFAGFDPARGVKLSTHVTNQLAKLSRLAYARQSTVSVPEQHRLTYNRYQRTVAALEDELGHPPRPDHVADRLGLPLPKLQAMLANVARRELLESGEGPAFERYSDDDLIHLAYQDMTPVQQRIFRLRAGYLGSPVRDGAGIMRELGLTQGQLSYELGKLKTLLERMQRLR